MSATRAMEFIDAACGEQEHIGIGTITAGMLGLLLKLLTAPQQRCFQPVSGLEICSGEFATIESSYADEPSASYPPTSSQVNTAARCPLNHPPNRLRGTPRKDDARRLVPASPLPQSLVYEIVPKFAPQKHHWVLKKTRNDLTLEKQP